MTAIGHARYPPRYPASYDASFVLSPSLDPFSTSPRLRMAYLSPIDAKPPYRPSLTSYYEPVTHRCYNGKWIENQQVTVEIRMQCEIRMDFSRTVESRVSIFLTDDDDK